MQEIQATPVVMELEQHQVIQDLQEIVVRRVTQEQQEILERHQHSLATVDQELVQ
jgi:hypothetical protein